MSIYVGGIPTSGMTLLSEYTNKFFPDDSIEDLSGKTGIRGILRNLGKRANVKLIVISSDIYESSYSAAKQTLNMQKTHKYVDDDGLRSFLISLFDDIDAPENPTPVLGSVVGADAVPDAEDLIVEQQDSSAEITELEQEIEHLKSKISSKDSIISNLKSQISTMTEDSSVTMESDSVSIDSRVSDLEIELQTKEEMLASLNNELF